MSTMCSPLFAKTPVVALPTSFDAKRHADLYHIPILTTIERLGARSYRYFMAYTQKYLDKMRAYNPTINARIIPEGVGDEFFAIKLKSPKYILSLGRIDINQKGLDLLIEAYAKIKHKTYPLIIAGKGNDVTALHTLIEKHKLEKHIKVLGAAFGEAKTKLLQEALYVVMPSRNEGFSLFSLEALASGLPLVTFDIDGFSWATSTAVAKAKAFDTDEYARLLEMNMKHNIISKKRTLARESVRAFTWDRVAKEFSDYFTYIVNKETLRKGTL